MNLNTLAKLAGVSAATVSKAFSGSNEISPETREKIFKVAKEHGCFDKYNKNKFDKKVIAVICPELNSDFYNGLITILDKKLSHAGGIMTVSVSNFSSECEAELFAYYSNYCKADGIISINQREDIINSTGIPLVSLFPSNKCKNPYSVRGNSDKAYHDSIQYLKDKGHTEIGFIGEQLTSSKLEKFKSSLRAAGLFINNDYIGISNGRFEQAGTDIIEQWLKDKRRLPTAILAAYDYIAIGIIKSLTNAGYNVPGDVSIIGYDDIHVGPYLEKSLSSISSNNELACEIAVDMIMKIIKNQYSAIPENIIIESEFIARQTTTQAPEKA